MQTLSSVAQSAYLDLVRSLQDDEIAALRGAPSSMVIGGKTFWYDAYRVGNKVVKRYLGEDSGELRRRIEDAKRLKAETEERRKQRTRLIRILRAEGFGRLDTTTASLISALAAAGVFRLGGTLVGTVAFRLYEGELGVGFSLDEAAQTDDIDIASFERLSLALSETESADINKVFADFEFDPVPSTDGNRVWQWRQTRGNALVEFLTPSFEDEEGLRPLPALNVHAQSLHFLNYLIAEPIKAALAYRSGVLVQIPPPERFAVHKLIVADRRRGSPDALKSKKDRRQASLLVNVLARDRPDELKEAWEEARQAGKSWRERIDRTLRLMPEEKAILEAL